MFGERILIFVCYIRFINIEPSAVDEERDTINVSDEESHENLTFLEQDIIITSSTISGETENSNSNTANTTMNPSLSTMLWNGLNMAKKTVRISSYLKIY